MEQEIQEQKVEVPQEKKEDLYNFKIFDIWDLSEIVVNDNGLKNAINLDPMLALKTHGRNFGRFGQAKINIIERLMNKLAHTGHRNKKHKIEKGSSTGKYTRNMKIIIESLKIVEDRKKENPVQVLVRAIENAAPRDETTIIEYGGARYPQAVDVSPIRRVNLALKHLVHGASDRSFKKKKSLAQGLAEEIILASEENGESLAYKKKKEAEAQADSAR
jgi:small subunit ribosomal protein S7